MKSLQIVSSVFTRIAIVLSLCFLHAMLTAQDKGLDIDVDINGQERAWYASPWVWAVGIAIFILLLVALLRGNKSA